MGAEPFLWYYNSSNIETFVENGAIDDNEQILLFTQCFQTRFKLILFIFERFTMDILLLDTFWITCQRWMITSNFALHQGDKYIVETFVEKEEMGHVKQLCSRLLHMPKQATYECWKCICKRINCWQWAIPPFQTMLWNMNQFVSITYNQLVCLF